MDVRSDDGKADVRFTARVSNELATYAQLRLV